jgi:hypothetical protein
MVLRSYWIWDWAKLAMQQKKLTFYVVRCVGRL